MKKSGAKSTTAASGSLRRSPSQKPSIQATKVVSLTPPEDEQLTLDPSDEFEKHLIGMVEMNRKKRADYASDDNIYANFDRNAATMGLAGYDALEDCLSMVSRKLGRIVNLRGRDPRNETVVDTFEDLAVYAVLALGLAKRRLQ
jgi:hypothetical protein